MERYAYPLTVTDTAARLPPPRAATTSSGTGIPVLLPVCAIVVSNRMPPVFRRAREDDGMGPETGVAVLVCAGLADAGVRFWLAGGWGVDTLAGRQTARTATSTCSSTPATRLTLDVLGELGYAVETDWRPIRVELVRPGSGWVDVHPVVIDAAGNGVQTGPDDTEFRYPAEIFTTGRVVGSSSAVSPPPPNGRPTRGMRPGPRTSTTSRCWTG